MSLVSPCRPLGLRAPRPHALALRVPPCGSGRAWGSSLPRLCDLGIATRCASAGAWGLGVAMRWWELASRLGAWGPRGGQRFCPPFLCCLPKQQSQFLGERPLSGYSRSCPLPCLPCLYSPFSERAIAANGRAVVPVPGPMDPDPKGAFVALGLVPDGEHSVLNGTQRQKRQRCRLSTGKSKIVL